MERGRNQHEHLIQSTGVLSEARREGSLSNWGRSGTGGGRASSVVIRTMACSGVGGADVPMKPGNAGGGKDPYFGCAFEEDGIQSVY